MSVLKKTVPMWSRASDRSARMTSSGPLISFMFIIYVATIKVFARQGGEHNQTLHRGF